MSLKIQAANDEKINNGTDHPKIQMISNFLSSAWSSLWTKEFIFCFSAAIGGLVVLRGLWLEYVSTDEKRYEKADIDGFRSLKSKEKCGEIWVMVGIWIEVAVAMLFAGIDVWDKHEINKNAAQNDPHNFPILSVLGYAMIEVRPLEPLVGFDLRNVPKVLGAKGVQLNDLTPNNLGAWLEMGRAREMSATNWDKWGTTETISDNVSVSAETDPLFGNEQFVRFDINFGKKLFSNREHLSANDVDAIALLLPIHCQIVSGKVDMIMNGLIEKEFQIPPQTTFIDVATSVMTNGAFVPFNLNPKTPMK
jgi:hypothetical protein